MSSDPFPPTTPAQGDTAGADRPGQARRTVSILFVCMGNICRSPMAEGVFARLLAEAGLEPYVRVDSAGTTGYHVGEPPDERAQRAAHARGYDLSALRARVFGAADCEAFDLILAMDRGNYNRIRATCAGRDADVRLFMEFARDRKEFEVPDPYPGGDGGFTYVMDLVEAGAQGLLEEVRAWVGA